MIRKRKLFCFDTSCNLYIPFFRNYPGSTIWDISGNGNHGTNIGAAPAYFPNLSGVELVTNGAFASDTAWIKGTGWTISGGKANKTAGVASALEQSVGAQAGNRYRLIYTMTRTAGALTPQIGGVNGTERSAGGTYEDIIVATGTGNLKFQANDSFAGTVDDVSVQKVVGYTGLGWQFDGVDDLISCPTTALPIGTGDFSYLWWAIIPPASSYGNTLTKVKNNIAGQTPYILIYPHPNKYIALFFNDGVESSNPISTIGSWIPSYNWEMWGVTLKRGEGVSFYKNGSLVNFVSVTTVTGSLTNDGNLKIGVNWSTMYLKMVLGEALAFLRLLSAQEIGDYYELTRSIYGG